MELDIPRTPIENIEPLSTEGLTNNRRRKKSIVWEYFTIETVAAGCTRACCKQCKKSFAYTTGSKLAGTSHLKRHIVLGICPVSRQRNQSSGYLSGSKIEVAGNASTAPKKRDRSTPSLASMPFDQERCNHEIARMIILHDYPLHIVEHRGFIDFVKSLQPQCNMMNFNTIQEECVSIYLREKQNLSNLLSGLLGHVNIAMDFWPSDHTSGYVLLTGHFIDEDWNLHRRLLNVVPICSSDSNDAFSQAMIMCLSDWHLENRLWTLVVDQSFLNDTIAGNLRSFLSAKNPIMLHGQLLIGNCFARVLSCLAQDALGSMSEIIWKIRESVKYVKTSDAHENKFMELKHHLQVPSTKVLLIDDLTRWDSTYHMLLASSELKEVFTCLDASDPDYRMTPSMEDWKKVDTLCTYLKILFDSANILTTTEYPAASAFFPEISRILIELNHAAMAGDPFLSNLIKPLQEKFEKYWRDSCLVLATAVVMDPRLKLKLVEFTFSKIFGENAGTWIKIVDDGIHEIFLDYSMQEAPLPEITVIENNEVIAKSENLHEEHRDANFFPTGEGLTDLDFDISDISYSHPSHMELDEYLEEPLESRGEDFEILSWWRLNKSKYPILSKMASDILSMPVSTVEPQSVFDTDVKKMDSYRSSLRPMTLEALMCAKDWFRSESLSSIVKMDV